MTAIYKFGGLISSFVRTRQSAKFFANIESFSAILKCFHRSRTSNEACWIAISISDILFHNPSSNKLLNSLPIVGAFSFIIPLANDKDAVEWISTALHLILENNEEAQHKFATPEFFKIFQEMEHHATTDISKTSFQNALGFVDPIDYLKRLVDAANSSQLKSAVESLPRHEKYLTEKVRDLLIAKKVLIADAETADAVVNFLFSFSSVESLRPLLRAKEVHDLIINHIAPRVTAIEEFGNLIWGIVQDRQSHCDLFSNVESFSAILECFHRSKTSKDARWIARSINNVLNNNPSANKLLNSLPVVEAFSFIIPFANDDIAVRWISDALVKIFNNNEEAERKFATPEFLKIFQGMEQHAGTNGWDKPFQTVRELLLKK